MSRTSTASRMECVRHELLSDVADQIAIILRDFGIDETLAAHCGSNVAAHLADHWGGQHVTIPMDYAFKLSVRDLEIFEQVRGNNIPEVAKRYGLTVNAVYRIIKRTKKRAIAKAQPDLFK